MIGIGCKIMRISSRIILSFEGKTLHLQKNTYHGIDQRFQ